MPPKKMGRPKIENPKSARITVRVDTETVRKLDASAEVLSASRADVVRKGIEKVYEDVQK